MALALDSRSKLKLLNSNYNMDFLCIGWEYFNWILRWSKFWFTTRYMCCVI